MSAPGRRTPKGATRRTAEGVVPRTSQGVVRRGRGHGRRGRGRGPARLPGLVGGVLGLVLAVGVAACGGLPGSSDVMPGDPIAAVPATPLRMHPATPASGASPESIVKGFLVAGSALSDDGSTAGPTVSGDYRPAREYLVPGVSERWVPRAKPALIYTGGLIATVLSSVGSRATVRVSAQAIAELDVTGRYSELPTTQNRSMDIALIKNSGQWRIEQLPTDFGLWLDVFYFNKSYEPFTVAYASPTARTIIPDRRFFPVTSGLVTALARAQLGPVPDYLERAVISGFPASARLSVESVTVRDGTATLDMTTVQSGAEERRMAQAQAIVTLTQATAVSGVSLQADGKPLELVGVSGPPYDLVSLGYDLAQGPEPATAVLRSGNRLVAVPPANLRKADAGEEGPRLPLIDPTYSKLAVGPDLKDFAAVSGDGTGLIRHRQTGDSPAVGASAVQPSFGTGLARPAFDTHQGLWLAGVAKTGVPTIWVIDTRGEIGTAQPVPVATPWLAGQTVVALKVAPDAQRVALLLRQGDGRVRVAVSGVVRGQDERATALTAPLYVGGGLVDAVDLTWNSAYQLTVLGRASTTQDLRATHVDLDGRAEGSDLPAVPGAHAIVALGGGHVGVVTGTGRLVVSVAGAWQDVGPVSDVVVP